MEFFKMKYELDAYNYLKESSYGTISEYITKLSDLWYEDYNDDVEESFDELMNDSDIRDLVYSSYEENISPSDIIDEIFNSYYNSDNINDDEYVYDNIEDTNEDDEYNYDEDDKYIDDDEYNYDEDELEESFDNDYEMRYLLDEGLSDYESNYLFERHEWDGMTPENQLAMRRLYNRFADAKSRGKFNPTNRNIDRVTATYINDFISTLPHVPNESGKRWIKNAIDFINTKRTDANLNIIEIPENITATEIATRNRENNVHGNIQTEQPIERNNTEEEHTETNVPIEPTTQTTRRRIFNRHETTEKITRRQNKWRVNYIVDDGNGEATDEKNFVIIKAPNAETAKRILENQDEDDPLVFDFHSVINVEPNY